ncbi:MAG: dephospho-CoA kinase [Acidobacteria bacterium]|nr:dephospho-CoA kinase [Acidobacteriota bacterium]
MLRVGLTGSIAVGKSFVSGLLAEMGCHVVDADELARRVVEPGAEGLRRVVEAFGEWVLLPGGTLDRARVGEVVFKDASKRELLNSLLHPLIHAEQDGLMRRWEVEDPRGVAVVDAALLIESGGYKRFDKVVVVHCRPEAQLERLMLRNRLSREEAETRIAAQMPQEEKLRHADFAIDTSEGFEDTRRRTAEVYTALRKLADGGAADDTPES